MPSHVDFHFPDSQFTRKLNDNRRFQSTIKAFYSTEKLQSKQRSKEGVTGFLLKSKSQQP